MPASRTVKLAGEGRPSAPAATPLDPVRASAMVAVPLLCVVPPRQEGRDARVRPRALRVPALLLTLLAVTVATSEPGDAKGARALFGEVLAEGKGLLVMKPPSDLRRDVVPHFLERRAAFGDALNAYGREKGGTDGATLDWDYRLADSFWAWYDAYRGRPAEGGV